jgi:regulation of enolase protein 1 (concanavalin A-like superfamily)
MLAAAVYFPRRTGATMKRQDLAWEDGAWTNEPVAVRRAGAALVVEAAKGSDFWEKTLYGFERASGHALLAPFSEQSAVEVSFDLRGFDALYDQAGVMLWGSRTQWIKAGVEINDGVPCVGAVVTDGYSDWSLAPVPEWQERIVTIRASRTKDAVIGRTIRVARFAPAPATGAQAGPLVCAPERAGLQVRFTRWTTSEADHELHWLPPAPDS